MDTAFKPSPQVHKLEFVSVSLTLSILKNCCSKLDNTITSFINILKPSNKLAITNLKAKLNCTYVDVWVNKIKILEIVDTYAPINVISTLFAKMLGIATDFDCRKEFGTAGLQSTTS